MDRPAVLAGPDEARLSLVGDAHGDDLVGLVVELRPYVGDARQHRGPELLGIMFHQSRARKVLGEVVSRARAHVEVGVHEQAGAARGALVDGEDELGGHGEVAVAG